MIVATAPGKAVIGGEYAVLDGAPAIVAAVDRRATVSVRPAGGDAHVLETRGFRNGVRRFSCSPAGAVEWLEPSSTAADFNLFQGIWTHLYRGDWPALTVAIDSTAFRDGSGGDKLGFGSSSAVTVALIAALQRVSGMTDVPDVTAFELHRRLQGGHGSGVDIAAGLHGGLIEYRADGKRVRALEWPAGLHYCFLWSGRSADTADRLATLAAVDSGRRRAAMSALSVAAEDLAAAWHRAGTGRLLASFRSYVDALRAFGKALDLGIFGAGHDTLADLAAATGIVYKPCGAGGGDIGIAIATEPQALDTFSRQASECGFHRLDVAIDAEGILMQGGNDA